MNRFNVIAFALATVIACTGGASSTTGDGTSSGAPSSAPPDAGVPIDQALTPQAIFTGTFAPATAGTCQEAGALFEVGTFGSGSTDVGSTADAQAAKNGEPLPVGSAEVVCSVTSNADGTFSVSGRVGISGLIGWFVIGGTVSKDGASSNLKATFARPDPKTHRASGTYETEAGGCTLHFRSAAEGIAGGRIGGEVACPRAVKPSYPSDPGSTPSTCAATAQFRFEACAQQ